MYPSGKLMFHLIKPVGLSISSTIEGPLIIVCRIMCFVVFGSLSVRFFKNHNMLKPIRVNAFEVGGKITKLCTGSNSGKYD